MLMACQARKYSGSLSARRAWIEIWSAVLTELLILLSLSARRAWIEIVEFHLFTSSGVVALRKESVDRNNTRCREVFGHYEVALRKESVDRNKSNCFSKSQLARSLSARRAWIEIILGVVRFSDITSRSPQGERG